MYREQNLSTRKIYIQVNNCYRIMVYCQDDTIEMSVEERFAKRLKLNLATLNSIFMINLKQPLLVFEVWIGAHLNLTFL